MKNKADPRTKGFQILSLLTAGDVRNDAWQSIYNSDGDYWTNDTLIVELRRATRIMWRDPFFANLKKWGFSMKSLIGERASQTFLAICHKRYQRHGCPSVSNLPDADNRESFNKDMRKTFDRFAFQHLHGNWTGGADQKLIDEIKNAGPDHEGNYTDVETAPNATDDSGGWYGAITKLINDGEVIDGDDLINRHKKPLRSSYSDKMRLILVYHAVLANLEYPSDLGADEVVSIDVEHIIPKKSWDDYLNGLGDVEQFSGSNKTHSLANLCLLGSNANRSKSEKTLSELGAGTDKQRWILSELERLGGVPKEDNSTFSQASQYSNLLEKRKSFLLDPFKHGNRMNVLTNDSESMYLPPPADD